MEKDNWERKKFGWWWKGVGGGSFEVRAKVGLWLDFASVALHVCVSVCAMAKHAGLWSSATLWREAHKCRTPEKHLWTNWKAVGYLCIYFVISQLLIKKKNQGKMSFPLPCLILWRLIINIQTVLIKNVNAFPGMILMLITEVEMGIAMASFPWSSRWREL